MFSKIEHNKTVVTGPFRMEEGSTISVWSATNNTAMLGVYQVVWAEDDV
jgi:hypothetical protein